MELNIEKNSTQSSTSRVFNFILLLPLFYLEIFSTLKCAFTLIEILNFGMHFKSDEAFMYNFTSVFQSYSFLLRIFFLLSV